MSQACSSPDRHLSTCIRLLGYRPVLKSPKLAQLRSSEALFMVIHPQSCQYRQHLASLATPNTASVDQTIWLHSRRLGAIDTLWYVAALLSSARLYSQSSHVTLRLVRSWSRSIVSKGRLLSNLQARNPSYIYLCTTTSLAARGAVCEWPVLCCSLRRRAGVTRY